MSKATRKAKSLDKATKVFLSKHNQKQGVQNVSSKPKEKRNDQR